MGPFRIVFFVFFAVAGLARAQLEDKSSFINGWAHDGDSITADLPESEHLKNVGSRLDGAGMCVFSAIEMAARHQGLEQMRGWRDWCAARYPGGGWPEKVERTLADWFRARAIEPIPYLQYEGNTPEEILAIIDRTRRMASITYGQSPRYGRGTIAHMVNGVHFGKRFGVVLDNNFPGDNAYEWMDRAELVRRARIQPGGRLGPAWIFVWLTPGSPPPPRIVQSISALSHFQCPAPEMVSYREHGVVRARLRAQGEECYCSINGQRVGFHALRAVLEDDSAKLWLIVTGPGREKVVADFKTDPRNASLVTRTRIWSVHEKHHSLYDRRTHEPLGFAIGTPGIYFAAADGTELHAQLGYRGPKDFEQLRKKDPDAPKPIPEPKKPEPIEPDIVPLEPEKIDPRYGMLVASGAIGVLLFLKGRLS